eukprot:UN28143
MSVKVHRKNFYNLSKKSSTSKDEVLLEYYELISSFIVQPPHTFFTFPDIQYNLIGVPNGHNFFTGAKNKVRRTSQLSRAL